ncbi:unnamed protein product [Prorocentrum cordatum]|uniref:Uncharacterized protein n=1 Tax=Prorocentrum cordatum TaxID=2364126 RepID=A0ABN9YC89_9DINO|nr:unnamed protein product [Polarella glacialis]
MLSSRCLGHGNAAHQPRLPPACSAPNSAMAKEAEFGHIEGEAEGEAQLEEGGREEDHEGEQLQQQRAAVSRSRRTKKAWPASVLHLPVRTEGTVLIVLSALDLAGARRQVPRCWPGLRAMSNISAAIADDYNKYKFGGGRAGKYNPQVLTGKQQVDSIDLAPKQRLELQAYKDAERALKRQLRDAEGGRAGGFNDRQVVEKRPEAQSFSQGQRQGQLGSGWDASAPNRPWIAHGGPDSPLRPGARGSAIGGPSPLHRRRIADPSSVASPTSWSSPNAPPHHRWPPLRPSRGSDARGVESWTPWQIWW